MYIKDWKLNQIRNDMGGGYLEEIIEVKRETEKAYLIVVEWGYTSSLSRRESIWVPKSATMTDEEWAAEAAAESKRFEDGCKRYEALVAWCKQNAVKGVRSGMKTATIMKKIEAAGLVYAV